MLKVHIRRTLIAAIIAGLFGFFLAYRMQPLYEASVDVMAGSPLLQTDQTMPIELKKVLMSGITHDLDSDTGVIRSQRIYEAGLKAAAKELGKSDLASPQSFQELYPLSDLVIPAALNVYAPEQQRAVQIKVRAKSRDDAASIANNVANEFSNYQKERSKRAVESALGMVKTQAANAKKSLDKIDKEFREIKIKNRIVDIQSGSTSLTEKVARLTDRKALTESELEGAKGELASIQAALLKTPKMIPGQSSNGIDPRVNIARQLEASAESELATEKLTYTDDAPSVIRIKEKLAAATKRRKDLEAHPIYQPDSKLTVPNSVYYELQGREATAKSKIQSLLDTLGPINASLAAAQADAAAYPGVESRFFDLQRNRLVYEEQYEKNQKWVQELSNSATGSTSQILNVADSARIGDPVAPDTKKYIILAAIVGSLIGLAYSFAIESFRLPVHTSWQLAELTALPVAASIPMMPKPLARRHYAEIRNADFKPIESFRYMAFSMMAKENRPGVILFTAVGEDVDSTGAAAEFAVAMSKTGSKTALVDCDLRLPRLSELFGVEGRSGVAEVLGRTILPGESTDLFVSTEHENLMILPAGAASASGLSDFNTSHMSGLIDDLRGKADTVVINCPPVDVFADASRLAQYVDEVCMVISAKTTSYRAIPVAQEILHKSGAKDMSIVLTNGSPVEEPFGTRTQTSTARR
jgi:Mrp family chromosome partitioning ATPase/uncharacterized protein involved in exopolysaccharide biosynthesis